MEYKSGCRGLFVRGEDLSSSEPNESFVENPARHGWEILLGDSEDIY